MVLNLDNSESRRVVEHCYRTTNTTVNPIIDWTDNDVWAFLKYYRCEGNPLYQCGESRIGCIGCPLSGNKGRKRDFAKYPKYKKNYIAAFERMLKARKEAGLSNDLGWKTGIDVMKWWIGENPDQMTLFDEEEIEEIMSDMGF